MTSNVAYIYYGFRNEFQPDSLISLLSEEEKRIADKIVNERERCLYIATRVTLRRLLADFLNVDAGAIQYRHGVNGKPFVDPSLNVQFSISHTEEVFVLGFTRDAAIGVDVEHLNRSFDLAKLSTFLFSKQEMQKFLRSDIASRNELFMNCWTRKEAVLKALGSGFTLPPNQLEVSFLQKEKPEVLSCWPGQEPTEWFLESLDIPENYRGAVAVQGRIDSIVIERVTSLIPQFN